MSKPEKPTVDAFAASVAKRAIQQGTRATTQSDLDSQAADVATFQRYESAKSINPIAAANYRQHHSAAIERGRQLTETAAAARPAPEVVLTAQAGAQRVADKQVFDRHQALEKTNPFEAARFRLENAAAIQRGSKVEIPEPAPAPPNPPNPPDDPPPQAA